MRRAGAIAGLILSTGFVGCGELDDDVATEASAITAIIVGARPMADAAFFPPDYYPAWSVQPSWLAPFDAINETTCNNTTDYIYTGIRGPIDAGAAFDIDVSAIPRGKTVSSMRAFVCARPHLQAAIGAFQGRVHYWNPAGDGQRKFLGNYGDDYRLPLVGLFGSNPFRLYEVQTQVLISISPTAKPATGGMRLRLWGDNIEISQVYLSIGYPTDTLPL